MDVPREAEDYGRRLMMCDVQREGWRVVPLGVDCSCAMLPS